MAQVVLHRGNRVVFTDSDGRKAYAIVVSASDGAEGVVLRRNRPGRGWQASSEWIQDDVLPLKPTDKLPIAVRTALDAVAVSHGI